MVLVAVELGDRGLDPHAFALMAALTVYSAITQPALAHAGQQSAERLDTALARLEGLEQQIVDLERQILERLPAKRARRSAS